VKGSITTPVSRDWLSQSPWTVTSLSFLSSSLSCLIFLSSSTAYLYSFLSCPPASPPAFPPSFPAFPPFPVCPPFPLFSPFPAFPPSFPAFLTFLSAYLPSSQVNGKTGNLGNNVGIERAKAKVVVTADIAFSKRYLKYLTKKYLKKNNLRDWLRVVASAKDTYELRYFQINNEEEEEDDEE